MSSTPQLSPSVVIRGIGGYSPSKIVTNDDLSKTLDTSDEWIRTRTGIRERRISNPEETPSFMGAKAAEEAMAKAGVSKDEIDIVVVGTMTTDLLCPSTACLIQERLDINGIPAFDITAACSGFLYTMETASALLKAGPYKTALVVGSEKMSGILDWQDRTTCVLFGDGAGAVVLQSSDEENVGYLGSFLGAQGKDKTLLYVPAGGTARPTSAETLLNRENYLKMAGKEVFKKAVKYMDDAARKVLSRFGYETSDVSLVVPHQANIRIIDSLADKLEVDSSKVVANIDRYGNTSAASIPLAIHEAIQQNRLQNGDLVLLLAFGAGLTWGASLIKWQN